MGEVGLVHVRQKCFRIPSCNLHSFFVRGVGVVSAGHFSGTFLPHAISWSSGCLSSFPSPNPSTKTIPLNQTGLNRPVFLPLKPFIPNYKPNNHKSGKPCPKTPHSGRSEKTGSKQNMPYIKPRLPFRAIFGSWVVRRSGKEISPSEVFRT